MQLTEQLQTTRRCQRPGGSLVHERQTRRLRTQQSGYLATDNYREHESIHKILGRASKPSRKRITAATSAATSTSGTRRKKSTRTDKTGCHAPSPPYSRTIRTANQRRLPSPSLTDLITRATHSIFKSHTQPTLATTHTTIKSTHRPPSRVPARPRRQIRTDGSVHCVGSRLLLVFVSSAAPPRPVKRSLPHLRRAEHTSPLSSLPSASPNKRFYSRILTTTTSTMNASTTNQRAACMTGVLKAQSFKMICSAASHYLSTMSRLVP